MTIEAELTKATGLKKKARESKARWAGRLVRGAQDLEDAKWEKLSEGAQQWVNDAVEAMNEENDIPEFPSDEASPAKKTTKKKAAKKKAASKKSKDEEEERTPEPKEKKKPKRGGGQRYREIFLTNPEMTKEELLEAITNEGFKLSVGTADIIYYEVRACLGALNDTGIFSDKQYRTKVEKLAG